MATRLEALIVNELQIRIGKLVSDYEGSLALLKAQSKELIELKDAEIQSLREELEHLKDSLKTSKK